MCDNHCTMQMPLLALGAALNLLAAAPASPSAPGAERIGRPAPAWSFERWIRTAPLSLDALRGKVVLIRWWTDDCHYCAATLPGLEALRTRYADRGLVVVGAYHPKPPRDGSDRKILPFAANRRGRFRCGFWRLEHKGPRERSAQECSTRHTRPRGLPRGRAGAVTRARRRARPRGARAAPIPARRVGTERRRRAFAPRGGARPHRIGKGAAHRVAPARDRAHGALH